MAKRDLTEEMCLTIVRNMVMLFMREPRPISNDEIALLISELNMFDPEGTARLRTALLTVMKTTSVRQDAGVEVVAEQFRGSKEYYQHKEDCVRVIIYVLKLEKSQQNIVQVAALIDQCLADSQARTEETGVERAGIFAEHEGTRQELEKLVNRIMAGKQTLDDKRQQLTGLYMQIEEIDKEIADAERDALASEIAVQDKLAQVQIRETEAKAKLAVAEAREAAAYRVLTEAEGRISSAEKAMQEAGTNRLAKNPHTSHILAELGIEFPDNADLLAGASEIMEHEAILAAKQLVVGLLKKQVVKLDEEVRPLSSTRERLRIEQEHLSAMRAELATTEAEVRHFESILRDMREAHSARQDDIHRAHEEAREIISRTDTAVAEMRRAEEASRKRLSEAQNNLRETLETEIATAKSVLATHLDD